MADRIIAYSINVRALVSNISNLFLTSLINLNSFYFKKNAAMILEYFYKTLLNAYLISILYYLILIF